MSWLSKNAKEVAYWLRENKVTRDKRTAFSKTKHHERTLHIYGLENNLMWMMLGEGVRRLGGESGEESKAVRSSVFST